MAKSCIWTAIWACATWAATAAAETNVDAQGTAVLRDHLEIGARIVRFDLKDTEREASSGRPSNFNLEGNFIGSLWGLEEIQDYVPRLYAQYAFIPDLGIGITYDHLGAKTLDWGDLYATSIVGDGDLEIWGPLVYLFMRYSNSTPVRPYAELGAAYYFASFDETAEWATTAPGYRFEVDDTLGFYLACGLDVALHESWHVDLYMRYLYGAEVDARAYFKPGATPGRTGSFPLDYIMAGAGLAHSF